MVKYMEENNNHIIIENNDKSNPLAIFIAPLLILGIIVGVFFFVNKDKDKYIDEEPTNNETELVNNKDQTNNENTTTIESNDTTETNNKDDDYKHELYGDYEILMSLIDINGKVYIENFNDDGNNLSMKKQSIMNMKD